MEIVQAGDSTVFVRFEDRVDVEVNRRVVDLASRIDSTRVPGVRDVVPAYASIAIHFDPLRTDYEALIQVIESKARERAPRQAEDRSPISIPVCYDPECGPDLADVASRAGLSEREVIALHADRPYRVFMLGFLPGFAYLGMIDERIAAPRLSTPRLRVARGSVGIAGRQTGIYPVESPGGWRIIGRTPISLFDVSRPQPSLFSAGDLVRFHAIDRSEFERLQATAR